MFLTQNFFDPNIFLTQNFFDPNVFLIHIFLPNFFWPKKFFDPKNFFNPKDFLIQISLFQIYFSYGHNSSKPVPSLCYRSRINTYLFISEVSWDRSHLCMKTVFNHKYSYFQSEIKPIDDGIGPILPSN